MSERRQLTPFPGKQRAIWDPTLAGMEQPLRSFESFMRTARPHPSPPIDKPLPPIPSSRDVPIRTTSSPFLNRPPSRNFSFTDWKAPVEWDDPASPKQDLQTSSFSAPRSYAPLIPEPSPGSFDDQEQSLWPIASISTTCQSRLEPINEHSSHVQSPPPYHSSHSSPTPRPIPESDCRLSVSSSILSASIASQMIGTYPTSSYNTNMEILALSPLSDVMLLTSNLSANHKALAWLGIESTRDKKEGTQRQADRLTSPQVDDKFHSVLSMQGRSFQSSSRGAPQFDESSDDEDMSERLRQLGVSQDYHNVLADQYHKAHDSHCRAANIGKKGRRHDVATGSKASSKDDELVPRPLSWKKNLYGSSPRSSESDTQMVATSPPNSKKRHRKMPSWVPFPQPTHAQKRISINKDQSQFIGDTAVVSRRELFGTELDRLMHKEIHLSHFIPHVRGLRPYSSDNDAPHDSSPLKPASPHPPSRHLPLTQSAPLLRLPGGLAIVRSTPTPTPTVRDDSILDISSPLIMTQSRPHSECPAFDVHPVVRRRSSLYSQQSESPVAPAMLVIRKLRSSFNSPPSHQSIPSTSSPPTSPLAYEIEIPRTPPPISRGPKPPSTRSQGHEASMDDDRADSANEDEPHRSRLHIGIFDKARDARDTWKKHQRDVKHEKLKQSIRVLGPTDPGVAAAYVRRQSRTARQDVWG